VVAFKDAGVRRLGRPLGVMLSRAIGDALADAGGSPGRPIWVVPVPSRRSAVRSRGADHTAVLAGTAARLLRDAGVPAHRCRALGHTRASQDQVGLSRADRIANVSGSLRALALPPGTIVIVDDVTTTGATVAEAVRALAAAGRVVSCAATVTRSGGHPWGASGTRAD
jgi:predicted amidophosphoribosyltransferase